jgi:hypothetical protein
MDARPRRTGIVLDTMCIRKERYGFDEQGMVQVRDQTGGQSNIGGRSIVIDARRLVKPCERVRQYVIVGARL